MGGKALDVDCHKGAVFTGISTFIQSSNGIRIFAGALASTGAEAELYCTSAELFCTPFVLLQKLLVLLLLLFIQVLLLTQVLLLSLMFFNRSSYKTEDLDSTGAPF